jgi:hypothetical protein
LPGADEGGGLDVEDLDVAVVTAGQQAVVVVERRASDDRLFVPIDAHGSEAAVDVPAHEMGTWYAPPTASATLFSLRI